MSATLLSGSAGRPPQRHAPQRVARLHPASSQACARHLVAEERRQSGPAENARGAGEGGEVEHEVRRLLAGIGQRVAQDHPARRRCCRFRRRPVRVAMTSPGGRRRARSRSHRRYHRVCAAAASAPSTASPGRSRARRRPMSFLHVAHASRALMSRPRCRSTRPWRRCTCGCASSPQRSASSRARDAKARPTRGCREVLLQQGSPVIASSGAPCASAMPRCNGLQLSGPMSWVGVLTRSRTRACGQHVRVSASAAASASRARAGFACGSGRSRAARPQPSCSARGHRLEVAGGGPVAGRSARGVRVGAGVDVSPMPSTAPAASRQRPDHHAAAPEASKPCASST